MKFDTLQSHIALAKLAHTGDTDKAGLDYFEHPYRVMQAVQAQGALPFVQSAAILHDVTEDTAFTVEVMSLLGVPEPVIELVKLLDRDYSENLFLSERGQASKAELDFFYYSCISDNAGAKMVKKADISDNTLEYRLSYLTEQRQYNLRYKYFKALAVLDGRWGYDHFSNDEWTKRVFEASLDMPSDR